MGDFLLPRCPMEEGEILFESNKKSQRSMGDFSSLRCPMGEIELLFELNKITLLDARSRETV